MNADKQRGRPGSNQRSTACCVPDARDLYQLSLDVEAIDDPIRSIDNLADSRVVVFWNDTTCFGMVTQNVRSSHQLIPEGFCALRIITGDETNDVAKVVASRRRPDQLASHVASCRLTSSCGIPSPRSS